MGKEPITNIEQVTHELEFRLPEIEQFKIIIT